MKAAFTVGMRTRTYINMHDVCLSDRKGLAHNQRHITSRILEYTFSACRILCLSITPRGFRAHCSPKHDIIINRTRRASVFRCSQITSRGEIICLMNSAQPSKFKLNSSIINYKITLYVVVSG